METEQDKAIGGIHALLLNPVEAAALRRPRPSEVEDGTKAARRPKALGRGAVRRRPIRAKAPPPTD